MTFFCVSHFSCKNCGSRVNSGTGYATPHRPFCSVECSIAYDNSLIIDRHTASACPHRVDASQLQDPPGRPRYVHGDCMSKLKQPTADHPRIETDGTKVKVTVRQGYTETTYTGEIIDTQLDMTRDSLDTFDGNRIHRIPGMRETTFTMRLSGVTCKRQEVHAEPHFVKAGRHGEMCVCECQRCHIGGECNCEDCPCTAPEEGEW